MDCREVEKILGGWRDGELGGGAAAEAREHLEWCLACRSEIVRLERLDGLIRAALKEEASKVRFDALWAEVEAGMAQNKPRRMRFFDWPWAALRVRRLEWAIPLLALSMVGIFALSDLYMEWFSASNGGRLRIESIDAHGSNVAVFRERQTRTTVIWLFQDEEGSDETPDEPVSKDRAL